MTATFIPVDILKEAHRLLAEYTYEKRPVQRGYANRTLHINLNDMHIEERPVTEQMKGSPAAEGSPCGWPGTRPRPRPSGTTPRTP